jgi:hypothetical protein
MKGLAYICQRCGGVIGEADGARTAKRNCALVHTVALHEGSRMLERKRTRVLNVRMTDEETAMLDAVAERDGQSVSDWIRLVVRTAFRKAFGTDAKPPRKKRK